QKYWVGSSDWLGIWCDCLLARNLERVMVGNQPPVPLLLHPHPGKASVTGDSFAFILPNHCREAGLHSRVSIDAHLNVIGSDRLKFQSARREIYNPLRLGSYCATWPYAYEISSVDAIKGRRISMNLCLNAFVIQFPDDLLDTCKVTAPRALLLPFAHTDHCKDEDSYKECSSHVEFSISLTRIRWNFSAFFCGIIPYNPLALLVAACEVEHRARSEEQSGDGRPVRHT